MPEETSRDICGVSETIRLPLNHRLFNSYRISHKLNTCMNLRFYQSIQDLEFQFYALHSCAGLNQEARGFMRFNFKNIWVFRKSIVL